MKIIKLAKHVYASAEAYSQIKKVFYLYLLKTEMQNNEELKNTVLQSMKDRGGDKLEAYHASLQEHAPDIYQMADDKAEMMTQDVMNEIDALGIDYRFESLKGALGMAKHDGCIISNKALSFDPGTFMFILFHELAHYHQYRKYGDDFAMSVYTSGPKEIEKDIDRLQEIELTANRFAFMKANFYLNKYELDLEAKDPSSGAYNNRGQIKQYLSYVKHLVRNMNPEDRNIRGINEMIYNLVN